MKFFFRKSDIPFRDNTKEHKKQQKPQWISAVMPYVFEIRSSNPKRQSNRLPYSSNLYFCNYILHNIL